MPEQRDRDVGDVASEAGEHGVGEVERSLERRVAERTKALEALNERLRAEIAERRRTEQTLRWSEARFQAFMHQNPAVAWMKDDQGRYVYVNDTLTKVYATPADDVLGRTDAELLPEPVATQLRTNDEQVLTTGQPVETVEHIPVEDGRIRSWRIWKFPFRDGSGRRHVGGLAFDITERLVAEETVRLSEERYRSLVESAHDSIIALSREGIITSLNAAFERITGWPREAWIGKELAKVVHPEDVSKVMSAFRQALEGENPPGFELRILGRQGDAVPMELTTTQQRIGEAVVGVLGIGRDIRERRQLEEQLRQIQKLDSIGGLAAGIAHDFNNLLGVQQAYLGLLRADPQLSPTQADMLQEIGDAAERAAALTRQLLLFSRKQVIQLQPVDVNESVAGLERMLGRTLGDHVELRLECAEVLPPVRADPGMIEQILMNLAINARDAMPSGGTLVISTQMLRLGRDVTRDNPEARPGHFVRLSVRDTGGGIPSTIMDRIFDPFFTTKPVGKGTGLGLATAHGIVKQHEGWIEVDSRQGQGTTFAVYLPVPNLAANVSTGSTVQSDADGGRETILLVEDEVSLRRSFQALLENHGYRVLAAEAGEQALAVWQEHEAEIDLLLTDLVMPGAMTGWQIADRLRELRPGLRVIFTSGYGPELAGTSLPFCKRSRFLQKPFAPRALLRLVRDCLDEAER